MAFQNSKNTPIKMLRHCPNEICPQKFDSANYYAKQQVGKNCTKEMAELGTFSQDLPPCWRFSPASDLLLVAKVNVFIRTSNKMIMKRVGIYTSCVFRESAERFHSRDHWAISSWQPVFAAILVFHRDNVYTTHSTYFTGFGRLAYSVLNQSSFIVWCFVSPDRLKTG